MELAALAVGKAALRAPALAESSMGVELARVLAGLVVRVARALGLSLVAEVEGWVALPQ